MSRKSRGNSGINDDPITSRKDPRVKKCRKKVFKRDRLTCVFCDKNPKNTQHLKIQLHHLKGWSKYPSLRANPRYCVTACAECHRKADKLTRQGKFLWVSANNRKMLRLMIRELRGINRKERRNGRAYSYEILCRYNSNGHNGNGNGNGNGKY